MACHDISNYKLFCCISHAKPAKLAKAVCDHLCELRGLGEHSKNIIDNYLLMLRNVSAIPLLGGARGGERSSRRLRVSNPPQPLPRGEFVVVGSNLLRNVSYLCAE